MPTFGELFGRFIRRAGAKAFAEKKGVALGCRNDPNEIEESVVARENDKEMGPHRIVALMKALTRGQLLFESHWACFTETAADKGRNGLLATASIGAEDGRPLNSLNSLWCLTFKECCGGRPSDTAITAQWTKNGLLKRIVSMDDNLWQTQDPENYETLTETYQQLYPNVDEAVVRHGRAMVNAALVRLENKSGRKLMQSSQEPEAWMIPR